MSLNSTLGSLAVATLLATIGGCVVRAQGHIAAPVAYVEVEEEPPPPRVVVVEARPGQVWVDGHWMRHGNRWSWHDGYWERERNGYVYEQGRWERRGRGHVWVDGRWRGNGNVRTREVENDQGNVRDHRSRPAPPPPGPAPTVRDHRRH